jgi:hypothetical protein
MSVSCRFERSLLNHEENETIRATHHPAIYDHDVEALKALRVRLRQMRDKERTLTRQKQREVRGKAEPRGASFPGTPEQPLHRKQVFAAAMKRVNKELARIQKLEARTAHVEAARRALALHRAAQFASYPAAGNTAHEGMHNHFRARVAEQKFLLAGPVESRKQRRSRKRCATREIRARTDNAQP